jgi:hypothetical protein
MAKKQDSTDTNEPDELAAGETSESPVIAVMTAINPEGIHERLEDAELEAMTGHPDVAHALNRITLLTGALKTALPEAIRHVDGGDLKAALQALFDIL